MTNHEFSYRFSGFAGILLAAATPALAQQDSTAARPDSAAAVTAWEFSEPGPPWVVVALTAGGGAMQFDCVSCPDWRGSSTPIFEASAGVQVSRSVLLLVSAGSAFTSGKVQTSVGWKTLAARIRPPSLRGLYLQPGVGLVDGTMTVTRTLPCDDVVCVLGAFLTFGLSVPTATDTLAVARGGVLELSAGYDLHLRGGVSLTPQFRWMFGQAGANGFSAGVQKAFGGTRRAWR